MDVSLFPEFNEVRMSSNVRAANYWQFILWGRETVSLIPQVPGRWFAVGTIGCLLTGLPWLSLLPFAAWNGLVALRNRWRCSDHAASS